MSGTLTLCDFCGEALDDDESLVPVYLGDPPEPRQQRFEAHAQKEGRTTMTLGRQPAYYVALYKALEQSRQANVEFLPRVESMRAVGGEEHAISFGEVQDTPMARYEPHHESDLVAARVTIDSAQDTPDPDLEVCEYCERSLRGEADA